MKTTYSISKDWKRYNREHGAGFAMLQEARKAVPAAFYLLIICACLSVLFIGTMLALNYLAIASIMVGAPECSDLASTSASFIALFIALPLLIISVVCIIIITRNPKMEECRERQNALTFSNLDYYLQTICGISTHRQLEDLTNALQGESSGMRNYVSSLLGIMISIICGTLIDPVFKWLTSIFTGVDDYEIGISLTLILVGIALFIISQVEFRLQNRPAAVLHQTIVNARLNGYLQYDDNGTWNKADCGPKVGARR